MSFDPIHRRYGYGAARVAIGVPEDSTRLSELAQRSSGFERSVAVLPLLLCTSIGLILAAIWTIPAPVATLPELAAMPTLLDMTPWDEPAKQSAAVPRSTASPIRPLEPKPRPAEIAETPVAPRPVELTNHEAEPAPAPFDLRQLAMAPSQGQALSDSTSRGDRAEPITTPRPQARPTALGAPTRSSLDVIARSLPAPSPLDAPAIALGAESNLPTAAQAARPTEFESGGTPEALAGFRQNADRSAYLASLTGPVREGPLDAQNVRRNAERPHVAAASAARETALEIRNHLREQARADGWDEVPLDALPACSPPEREDALKKRILLVSSSRGQRDCAHPSGQYRFLETRNLNAFLMWSRPNQASLSRNSSARDVCDVLERALLCLEGGSTEEP